MPDSACLIIANGFGTPCALLSNRFIAYDAVSAARNHSNTIIFTQKDVEVERTEYFSSSMRVERIAADPSSTWKMNLEAAAFAKRNGISTIIVVGAWPRPFPHVWRCQRDILEALKQVGHGAEVVVRESRRKGDNSIWLSRDSKQWWTRNALFWAFYEGILQHLPFWLYRRVTG